MKPRVICHMVCSVDGRTRRSRWRPQIGGGDLFEVLHERIGCDAWLVGRVTGYEFSRRKDETYPAYSGPPIAREHFIAKRGAAAYGVVLDTHGKLVWGRADVGGDPIVVLLSEQVSDAHLAGLRGEGHSYVFAGRQTLDLALALELLNRELGIRRLLLEGGGTANGAFSRRAGGRDQRGDPAHGRRRQGRVEHLRRAGRCALRAGAAHVHDAQELRGARRRRGLAAL